MTVRAVRLPTVVILGCEAVSRVPVTEVAETSVAETVPAVLILPPYTLPVTDRPVRVPTDVILGWAFVCNVPVTPADADSVVNEPVDGVVAPTDPFMSPVITPETERFVSVPTVVMLGCDAV